MIDYEKRCAAGELTLVCDGCGAERIYHPHVTPTGARREAKAYGWIRKRWPVVGTTAHRLEDLCPKCAAAKELGQ